MRNTPALPPRGLYNFNSYQEWYTIYFELLIHLNIISKKFESRRISEEVEPKNLDSLFDILSGMDNLFQEYFQNNQSLETRVRTARKIQKTCTELQSFNEYTIDDYFSKAINNIQSWINFHATTLNESLNKPTPSIATPSQSKKLSQQKSHSQFFFQGQVEAEYHSIERSKKLNKEHEWFLKECITRERSFGMKINGSALLSSMCEAVGGELMRYFIGLNQPKTRVVYDIKSGHTKISIASKAIPNFKSLEYKEDLLPQGKLLKGLAACLFMSYFLKEWDAKPENFYFSNNTIGRFDFEWCFYSLRSTKPDKITAELTASDLMQFPCVQDFRPGFWPMNNEMGKMLSTNKVFITEVYTTILYILITPPRIILTIIENQAHAPELQPQKIQLCNTYFSYFNELKEECLKVKKFRDFVLSEGENCLKEIMKIAEVYCFSEKIPLTEESKKEFLDNFSNQLEMIKNHKETKPNPAR